MKPIWYMKTDMLSQMKERLILKQQLTTKVGSGIQKIFFWGESSKAMMMRGLNKSVPTLRLWTDNFNEMDSEKNLQSFGR